MRKVKKKYTAFYMVIILMINFVIGTMPVAANENDDILNHLTTTVTIRDADTGEMTSYKINNHKLKVSESQNGSVSTLVIHDIGSTIEDSQLQRSPSQSNSDTYSSLHKVGDSGFLLFLFLYQQLYEFF